MNLWLRTALARRRMRRRTRRISPFLLLLLSGCLVLLLLIRMRPKLTAYAENYIEYQTTTIMERVVADCTEENGVFGQAQTGAAGNITSFTADTAAVNRLRTKIVRQVYDGIAELEQTQSSVAAGTLLQPNYLAGLGPQIPFGIAALGQVTAKVDSSFSAAGINQTIYAVTIRISADFSLRMMGSVKNVTISAEYPLEETIIVGEVPMIAAESE